MDPTPVSEATTDTLTGGNSRRGGSGDLGNAGLRSRAGNLASLTDADRQALAELLDTPIRLNVREFLALNLDHTIGRAVAVGPLADGDARADRRSDSGKDSKSHATRHPSPNGYSDRKPLADAVPLAYKYASTDAVAKSARLPAYAPLPRVTK